MQEGLPWGDSPLDDDEETDRPGLGWATLAVYSGSAMLMLLNAHAILNWANQLDLNDETAPIVLAAEDWHGKTGAYGLNIIVDSVKQAAVEVRAAKWPDLPAQWQPDAPAPSAASRPHRR